MVLHRLLGGKNDPGRPVGHLRAVSGRDIAIGFIKDRPKFGKALQVGIGPNAIVAVVDRALGINKRCKLVGKAALLLRAGRTHMTAAGKEVHVLAGNAKTVGKVFCGLAHRKAHHRVCQTLQNGNNGGEHGRHGKPGEVAKLLHGGLLLAHG